MRDDTIQNGPVVDTGQMYPNPETTGNTGHDSAAGAVLGVVGGAVVGGVAGGPVGAVVGAIVGGVASGVGVAAVDRVDHDGSPAEFPLEDHVEPAALFDDTEEDLRIGDEDHDDYLAGDVVAGVQGTARCVITDEEEPDRNLGAD